MPPTMSPIQPNTRTMVVLVADKMDPGGVTILEQAGLEVRVQPGLSPEELVAAAQDVDGILVRSASRITEEVIEAAPKLKAVGRAGIGVDNIDLQAASRHGVLVMNTPLANATTTAELAVAHMMSLARHLPQADASMKAGRWDKSSLVGHEITGKTLVIVGLGKIGRIAAERGLGLKMNVIAYDPFLTGESPVPGVRLVELDEALELADYLSIHVPKSPETLGLIDAAAMKRMKPTACLINCARGGIIVEEDLCAALEAGELGGAALDVFASEPLSEDSPLRKVPNLQLTPHLGASSSEAQKRVSTEIAMQMADYLQNDEARCAVNAPSVSAEDLATLRPYMTLGRRSGLLLAQVAEDPIIRVEVSYRGDLARRETNPVKLAVLAGILSPALETPVNAVNAEMVATERGLKILEECSSEPTDFTSLLKVHVITKSGSEHTLAGTVYRERPRLVRFEDFGVDFELKGHLLLTRHRDAPGVLGAVATWLGSQSVNIAGLQMASHENTDAAMALYDINRALTTDELKELSGLPQIVAARTITL
ncbi:MAG: phosphoglycerate dehydrogenase [Planctomycetota bacterium]|nr:phosphoglycerate dehydrogenase [Planctomycetota bacterium]